MASCSASYGEVGTDVKVEILIVGEAVRVDVGGGGVAIGNAVRVNAALVCTIPIAVLYMSVLLTTGVVEGAQAVSARMYKTSTVLVFIV